MKTVHAGRTWFPRGRKGKGTERRAGKLTSEYESTLREYDVRFHHTAPLVPGEPEPPQGPLVRRLRSYGKLLHLVAGPWGDLSEDFHELLWLFAQSRANKQARAAGSQVTPGMLGKLVGEVRRSFSVEVVRLHAKCLLERIQLMQPQARVAVQNRRLAVRREERRRQEAEAYRLAHGPATVASRIGRAFVE